MQRLEKVEVSDLFFRNLVSLYTKPQSGEKSRENRENIKNNSSDMQNS